MRHLAQTVDHSLGKGPGADQAGGAVALQVGSVYAVLDSAQPGVVYLLPTP